MCEIALCVVDTVNSDFYKTLQCYKAGDVIEVVPDCWTWGRIDLSFPNWRILQFPGLPVSAFSQFLTSQVPTDPKNPSRTLLRRALSFNYPQLPSVPSIARDRHLVRKLADFIADFARACPTLVLPLAVGDVAALTITKPLVDDPTVFGAPPTNVFG